MRKWLQAMAVLAAVLGAAFGREPVRPFETAEPQTPANAIDAAVAGLLRSRGMEPAYPCSDEVFVRRVYLDTIGALPELSEIRSFLWDGRPDRRAALIESLLEREEFADYQALKWCDVLRVKAEFPINLWPNAVQAYHRWIRDAVRDNMPYDRFARELLTSSGSNFRVPQVNFYRAVQGRDPGALADAAALTFMGARTEYWPPQHRADLALFFSRVAFKETAEWKEEIVHPDPAKTGAFEGVLPDGTRARVKEGGDPREAFANWLITEDNPWFARAVVNRIWSRLMGRGIIEEVDDIRPDNPPANPELLACLENELTAGGFDLRRIYRLILNSRTYQQSSIPRSGEPEAESLFACYPVRILDAEVLIDALCRVTGSGEGYSSAIPEPFTFVPEDERTVELADGSITSQFLEMFGRPARDTGLESERTSRPTQMQRLHLLNSTHIQGKIERGPRLREIAREARGDRRKAVRLLYLNILSRGPTPEEEAAVLAYFEGGKVNQGQAAADLAWALLNSKEFLYRH